MRRRSAVPPAEVDSIVKERVLHDGCAAFGVGVGFSEGLDVGVVVTVGGAEGDDEDLVFGVVEKFVEFGDHLDFLFVAEFAAEYGVLEVVAVAAHFAVDKAEAFVVGDVVGDDVYSAHGFTS